MSAICVPVVYGSKRDVTPGVLLEWTCLDFSYSYLANGTKSLAVSIILTPAVGQICISKRLFLTCQDGVITNIEDLGDETLNQASLHDMKYETPLNGFDIDFVPQQKTIRVRAQVPVTFTDVTRVEVFLQDQFLI